MKMRNTLLTIGVIALGLTSVGAEYVTYDTAEKFEKAKGEMCEVATDGCNTYFMVNGKVWGGTLMACKEDFKPQWTCKESKEGMITTTAIEFEAEKTFPGGLSENDYNFYLSIKKSLNQKYQNHVNKMVSEYLNKLDKYSNSKKSKINDKVVVKLDDKIAKFLSKFPQDAGLADKDNNKFLMLELLKFELQQLDFKSNNIIGWNKALKIAKSEKLESMAQSHDLTVRFVTKKGNSYTTKEAKIDDYLLLQKACGSTCKNMPIMSE